MRLSISLFLGGFFFFFFSVKEVELAFLVKCLHLAMKNLNLQERAGPEPGPDIDTETPKSKPSGVVA